MLREHVSAKVFLTTLLMLTSIGLLSFLFLAYTAPNSYANEINTRLDQAAQQFIRQLKTTDKKDAQQMFRQFAQEHQVNIEVYDDQHRLLNLSDTAFSAANVKPSTNDDEFYQRIDGENINKTVKEYSFHFADQRGAYTMVILADQEQVFIYAKTLWQSLPLLMAGILLLSLLASYGYAKRMSDPIVAIMKQSQRLANLDFEADFTSARRDEIGQLADHLASLSKQLSTAMQDLQEANADLSHEIAKEKELEQQQLSFFAAISHELKTPLTILKGQTQGMLYRVGGYRDRDTYLKKNYQVIVRMEELVQEILMISKLKSTMFSLQRQPVSCQMLVQDCVRDVEDYAMQKDIQLYKQYDEDACIEGDQGLLETVLHNVLTNAIQYSPAQSEVFVQTHIRNELVWVMVENTKAALPDEVIATLFQPFTRHEASRNSKSGGSGLGLYITAMILDLHGVSYSLYNTKRGVCFQMAFPIYKEDSGV